MATKRWRGATEKRVLQTDVPLGDGVQRKQLDAEMTADDKSNTKQKEKAGGPPHCVVIVSVYEFHRLPDVEILRSSP